MSNIKTLITDIVSKRPNDVREDFKEIMVDYIREAVEEHKEVVAKSLFDNHSESEDEGNS